jgi:hypothetical protein
VDTQTEKKSYLVVQIKKDEPSDETGPEGAEPEGVVVNHDGSKSCHGIGEWHQGDDHINDEQQLKCGLSNDLASYDRDFALCGTVDEGQFEPMPSYSCCTVTNYPWLGSLPPLVNDNHQQQEDNS